MTQFNDMSGQALVLCRGAGLPSAAGTLMVTHE